MEKSRDRKRLSKHLSKYPDRNQWRSLSIRRGLQTQCPRSKALEHWLTEYTPASHRAGQESERKDAAALKILPE